MDYCYNVGKINIINANIRRVGQISGEAYTSTVNNCYGIIGQINAIGINASNSTISNVTLVEKNEMTDILEVIGENFKEDANNINNGYPLLQWQ